jgi:hypothetical protein
MKEDPRCCGTGTCIIDPEGRCWCGQQWDGEKMAMPKLDAPSATTPSNQNGQVSPSIESQ